MSTVREICRRALMRCRVYGPGDTPSADDMADAVAQLNDMMFAWKQMGVDVGHETVTADDEFSFYVPPLEADADTISEASFRGAWDANANSPTLSGSSGTRGYIYEVTTAGSTSLDGISSWVVGDFAVFDGKKWRKGRSSRPFDGAVIAMLAVQLTSDHGKEPVAVLVREAAMGWRRIQACYVKPKMNNNIDLGLVHMSSRQFIPDGTLLGE